MSSIQIKSNLSIEELIESLSQLDTPTLDRLVASLRKVQQKRKRRSDDVAMPECDFWNLIGKIDWKKKDDEARLSPLVNALADHSAAEIYQFTERLALLLHQLDGPAFAESLEQDRLGFSADTFLYARCYVVARGEKFYKSIQTTPFKMPVGKEMETMLYVAPKAYHRKTGNVYHYVPTVNYESFFNKELWGESAASI